LLKKKKVKGKADASCGTSLEEENEEWSGYQKMKAVE
jgi:hypothetical protein